ncbi:MAG: ATP-binding protein [Deltaproteobacteria bacterium]
MKLKNDGLKKNAGGANEATPVAETQQRGAERLGFQAASGLPDPKGGRFNPTRQKGGALDAIAAAMQKTLDAFEGRLAAIGAVCSKAAAENPSAELYYHVHGGQPYVFTEGTQPDRVLAASVKVAGTFAREDVDAGPVRLITWSSAGGWLELYPQDGTPVAYSDDQGTVVPYKDLTDETERSTYNNKGLQRLLYGSDGTDAVNDLLSPNETLQAVDRVQVGEQDKRGRIIFTLNGLGPHLRGDLDGAVGNGRIYQQLVDMRGRMDSTSTTKHIIFNDGPSMMPTTAAELGSSYSMPMPTKRMMAGLVFGSVTGYLWGRAAGEEKAPEDVTDKEIGAWREVVGDDLKEGMIRNAIADGITLDQFKDFLPEGKTLPDLSQQLIGFTTHQAKDLMGEAVSRASGSSDRRIDFEFISRRRFDMLKKNFNIELVRHDPNMPEPMGLGAVMNKLDRLRAVFKAGQTRKKPLQAAKMMLLAGVPGMGKSLVAKSAASKLDMPLVKVDLAKLFNKFVGESESNFARMFELLESLAPCVVWLDEIEKALGGSAEGTSAHDGGVTDRVHGLLLTWIEEHKSDILLLGTCNEPQKLSSAFVSRSPAKYFVGYQDAEGLADIWKSNLDALTDGHDLKPAQIKKLVEAFPTISGREVYHAINAAREVALVDRPDQDEVITLKDIEKGLEGYRTDYQKDPFRAQVILAQASAYESASGKAILDPSTGEAPVTPAPQQGDAPTGDRPARRAGVNPSAMDSV